MKGLKGMGGLKPGLVKLKGELRDGGGGGGAAPAGGATTTALFAKIRSAPGLRRP